MRIVNMFKMPTWMRMMRSRHGHAGIMFSILAMPMVMAIGFAIDFTQASKYKTNLQDIADAVALTAVRSLPISEMKAFADGTSYYEAAISDLRVGLIDPQLTLSFEYDPNFKAIVEITASVQGAFGNTIGLGTFRYEVDAEAILGRMKSEVAMVVDLSASMKPDRMKALGESMGLFVSTLDSLTGKGADRLRVGIVPFSRSVKLPTQPAANWLRLPSERATAIANDDVCIAPMSLADDSGSDTSVIGRMDLHPDYAWGCMEEELEPLTLNRTRLNALINKIKIPDPRRNNSNNFRNTAYWGTSLYAATGWAYRMLDPDWSGQWPAGSGALPANQANKIVIMMTDGTHYDTTPYTVGQADTIYRNLCTAMKNENYTLYTVSFKAPPAAKALLKNCASSDSHFIDANNDDQLRDAYTSIARQIGDPMPRLVF